MATEKPRRRSDATVCRENGWPVGTVVEGDCPFKGRVSIRVTAIGESNILARRKGCAEGHNWDLWQWGNVTAIVPRPVAVECDHPWHRNPATIFPCPECGAGAEPAAAPSPERRERE